MYSIRNRIYCHDCNRSYLDRIYSNHLRSQGHNNNVMKKHCCSYNSAITRDKLCCNNHDLTCCKSELYFRSADNTQRDFSDKQNSTGRKKSIDNSVR